LISKITQFRRGNLGNGNGDSTVRVATIKPPEGQRTKLGSEESRPDLGTKVSPTK
jgi:hypothetical protein